MARAFRQRWANLEGKPTKGLMRTGPDDTLKSLYKLPPYPLYTQVKMKGPMHEKNARPDEHAALLGPLLIV